MQFKSLSIDGPKDRNQDAVMHPIDQDGEFWVGIADGVGSANLGGVAAKRSLEIVSSFANGNPTMTELFHQIQNTLRAEVPEGTPPKALTTTLTVLKLAGTHATVGHVGDTRITHYRNAGVLARTKDQTEVQKLLDDGALTKNQAARYPRRNVLLSAMSPSREFELFEEEFEIMARDRILLTTDGFHTKLLRGQIARISASNDEFDKFWSALLDVVRETTFDDDASCIALEI
jgi:PPM family protein phosphatase